jgi:protein-L-isoaspartate(D-aspartate) O-methyltransferase
MTIEEQQAELRRQLEQRGITDERVLDAIEKTRRDLFVPEDVRPSAYADTALPIGCDQTISQPYMVAIMTQCLELRGPERVLEIGTGSGYQAAILAQLCAEVVTVERWAELSAQAQQVLREQGYANIEYVIGDGTLGYRDRAPYDGIIVTAAAPDVPSPLYNQLAIGGRLVIPVGDENLQSLQVVRKQATGPIIKDICDCRFVKLIGDAGWPEVS